LSPDDGSPRRSKTRVLGKESRVRKRREFLQIQSGGRRVSTRHFLVVYVYSGDGPTRLGITVTKKIGNAVVRNRIKRAVRETFRRNACRTARGASLVVIARDGAGALGGPATAAELEPAFATIGCGASSAAGSAHPSGAQ